MSEKDLIQIQTQEQMEQAVECFNAGEFLAASAAFEECARLMKLLELNRQQILQESPQQLTIDITQ